MESSTLYGDGMAGMALAEAGVGEEGVRGGEGRLGGMMFMIGGSAMWRVLAGVVGVMGVSCIVS